MLPLPGVEVRAETGQTQLQYGSNDDPRRYWPGRQFREIHLISTPTTRRHDAWPLFLGKWPQLPKAIYLENQNSDDARHRGVPKGLEIPCRGKETAG